MESGLNSTFHLIASATRWNIPPHSVQTPTIRCKNYETFYILLAILKQITPLPPWAMLEEIFNCFSPYTITATLKWGEGGNYIVVSTIFALDCSPNPNLKLYVLLCDRMHINLCQGFLFCTTDPKGCVIYTPFLGSAVANHPKKYLSNLHLDDGETAHSFRAGCSITLSLLGASNEAIAKHVGWRSVTTAAYYTQTDAVMHPTRTSALLTANHSALSALQDSPCSDLERPSMLTTTSKDFL